MLRTSRSLVCQRREFKHAANDECNRLDDQHPQHEHHDNNACASEGDDLSPHALEEASLRHDHDQHQRRARTHAARRQDGGMSDRYDDNVVHDNDDIRLSRPRARSRPPLKGDKRQALRQPTAQVRFGCAG